MNYLPPWTHSVRVSDRPSELDFDGFKNQGDSFCPYHSFRPAWSANLFPQGQHPFDTRLQVLNGMVEIVSEAKLTDSKKRT
jgi:hypothetical protein